MDILLVLVTIGLLLIISFITFFKRKFNYWKDRNIPFKQPTIPFGTISNPLGETVSPGEITENDYFEAKAARYDHMGVFIFYKPVYVPINIEIIKSIMTKDFNHFVDRGLYVNEINDPISNHLFLLEGTKWKNLRAKMTPTFTSGKMKNMFPTLVTTAEYLNDAMGDYSLSDEPIDVKDVMGRYTTDVIGSCAFGLDCNSFENPNSDFRKYGKKAVIETPLRQLISLLTFMHPHAAKRLGILVIEKDVSAFYLKVIKETLDYRKANNVKRNDFLQLLIDLQNDSRDFSDASKVMKGLTFEEVAAQAFLFFLAGFETSSTTLTFCLYELAVNPDCQAKVRDEINEVLERHDGKLTYDSMNELKYMAQVIDESLRKFPPVPVLHRYCVEEYKVPNTNNVLSKYTNVFIPVWGLHKDPEYFPDPDKFDPERFSVENKPKITPFTYLPFGDGPRNCIGLRFGLMQVKTGLALLLKNFSFSLNEKTITPLKMDPESFIPTVKGGIWLNVEKVG